MATKCYWSILTVGLMAVVLASSDRRDCYILAFVKHITCKLALTTVIFCFP